HTGGVLELAVLIRDDADRQRHHRYPQDITPPVASEEVTRAAILFRILVRDQLVEDLDDLLAARPHVIERDVEDEVVSADVADEALGGMTLHDVAQQPGQHPDDAVALVVAVPVVVLLEMVEVCVADSEQLVAT